FAASGTRSAQCGAGSVGTAHLAHGTVGLVVTRDRGTSAGAEVAEGGRKAERRSRCWADAADLRKGGHPERTGAAPAQYRARCRRRTRATGPRDAARTRRGTARAPHERAARSETRRTRNPAGGC